jgi:hypothetical protein
VKDGVFFRARTVLSAMASHYGGINLQATGEGFANGRSDDELDALERAAALVANALA